MANHPTKGVPSVAAVSVFKAHPQSTVLAHRIQAVRETLNMSRDAFANLMSVPPTTLKNYELSYRHRVPVSFITRMLEIPELKDYVAYLISPVAQVNDIYTINIPVLGFKD